MLLLLQSHIKLHTPPIQREVTPPIIIPIEEDDELLLAWFMFMRQPHE